MNEELQHKYPIPKSGFKGEIILKRYYVLDVMGTKVNTGNSGYEND